MSSISIDNRVIAAAAFVAILAVIAKPVWDGRDQSPFGSGRDDATYMVTAKSLAEGGGYRHANLPGGPYETKYPPLYPLFLSIAWRIQPDFPRTLETASLLQDCLLPVYLALLLAVLRQLGLSWRRTILIAAMVFLSFEFLFVALTLFSELLFGCFLLAAIWVIERSVVRNSTRWALAGGLLTGLAFLTRSAALPMLLAVPIFFFLRKRPRLTLYFFATSVPIVVLWNIFTMVHSVSRIPYVDEYLRVIRETGLGPHLLSQAAILSAAVADIFWPRSVEFLHGIPLHHLVLAAAISGCVRIGRRLKWPLYLLFSAPYMVMITCWWFQGINRLLLPVWPMLLVGIAEEASHFANLAAQSMRNPKFKSAPRWALIALATCLVIRNYQFARQKVASTFATEREDRMKDRMAYAWISEHAGKGSLVLAWKDSLAYLYTGIPSSHDLFVATIPQSENLIGLRTPFDLPKGEFQNAILLLLASDLGDDASQLESFRVIAESHPGSKLEYNSPGAYIYTFPVE